MDKIIGLIVVLSMGALATFATLKISEVMDDSDNTELCEHDDIMRIYIPCRYRNRRRNNRHDKQEGKR